MTTTPNLPLANARSGSLGSSRFLIPLALMLVAQVGCADAPRDVSATADNKPSIPSSVKPGEPGTTIPAAEQDIVLDLRQETPEFQADAEETRRIVAATFGAGAPEDLELTARASGHFTSTDQTQTAYILLRRAAMQPRGHEIAKPMLAVFDPDGRILTQFVVDFWRIAAVADVDGDGVDELLLASDVLHMGLFATSIELVSVRDGDVKVLQSFPEVFMDTCEQSVSKRFVEANVFMRGRSGLVAETYRADCDGDPATRASRFQRVPSE